METYQRYLLSASRSEALLEQDAIAAELRRRHVAVGGTAITGVSSRVSALLRGAGYLYREDLLGVEEEEALAELRDAAGLTEDEAKAVLKAIGS